MLNEPTITNVYKHPLYSSNLIWIAEFEYKNKEYIAYVSDENVHTIDVAVALACESLELETAKRACNLYVKKGN